MKTIIKSTCSYLGPLAAAACAAIFFGPLLGDISAARSQYPDLRDSHSPELQAALDKAFNVTRPISVKRPVSVVVADVTDLEHPRVAGYNPEVMLYAASLPKIAIVLGVITEIDRGVITLEPGIRKQLIGMIRHSSNQDATAMLNLVGIERLAQILQDEQYGKLYDPEFGGGLWVGKEYGKGEAKMRDPLHGISHGASAMQAARFYYGALTGTIIDHKYRPLLKEIFGQPAIKHKFVKGLEGREDVTIYRKSGTWRNYHADSGVVVHDDFAYIVVYIAHDSEAGQKAVEGIRIVDDVMKARAKKKAQ